MNGRQVIAAASRLIKTRTVAAKQVRSYGGHGHAPYKHPNLDELPLPQGSWQAYNAKQNAKFNRHLFLGVAFFLFSGTVLTQSGIVTWNYAPPPLPEETASE